MYPHVCECLDRGGWTASLQETHAAPRPQDSAKAPPVGSGSPALCWSSGGALQHGVGGVFTCTPTPCFLLQGRLPDATEPHPLSSARGPPDARWPHRHFQLSRPRVPVCAHVRVMTARSWSASNVQFSLASLTFNYRVLFILTGLPAYCLSFEFTSVTNSTLCARLPRLCGTGALLWVPVLSRGRTSRDRSCPVFSNYPRLDVGRGPLVSPLTI